MRPRLILGTLALCLAGASVLGAAPRRLNCRDGRDAPPRLYLVQNLWGLRAYPSPEAEWPDERKAREIRAAGFDAFDVWVGGATEEDLSRWEALAGASGLGVGVEFGPARPEDADAGIAAAMRLGSVYLDAHVAGYFTPEGEAEALLRGLVERCARAGVPLVVQTHRGRVTQDLLRTAAYARAIPDLRLDLDFSHYLVAGEMGGPLSPEAEAAFGALMERTVMLDGRVSNGEQVQVDLLNPLYREHVERQAALWKRVMVGWLRTAERGEVFPFRVELGPPDYAIRGRDGREISDRWEQQRAMRDLVERLWNEAVAETGRGDRHGPALAVAAGTSPSGEAPVCDLLFAGGRVVDGTGAPWYRADVCVAGDRIAAIGSLEGATARRRVDASRLVVAPGFIDMMGQSEYNLLVDGRAASKITQGITTEITGEGSSIAPLDARMLEAGRATYERYGYTPTFTTLAGYFRELEGRGTAVNLGTFVGAGGVRDLVIGQEDREATAAELEAMKAAVARAMEEGALGLSSSLIYVPDRFASTEELVALARVAARYGGSYITHQRDEGDDGVVGLDGSMQEVFRIAREAGIPAEIYHLKASGRRVWGRMPELLRMIEAARAEGLDVSADQYPWAASSNNLDASLPAWVREGGIERLVARLADPATRARARADFLKLPDNADWPAGAERILVTSVLDPGLKEYEGLTIGEIAGRRGADPLDALMDLVVADRGHTGRVTFSMSEDDVRLALRHPLVSFCTDSGARAEDGPLSKSKTHPRAFGSAARILGHYVRDEKVLTLEEAVRKMTSLPASRVRLHDRGILRPGMAADLVAFDPETVRSRATYADPLRYSEGIPYVAVNGQLVVDEGRITEARPGRVLRGPGYAGAPSR